MKTVFIVLATAILSSAGTFYYTSQKMSPRAHRSLMDSAEKFLVSIQVPSSQCKLTRDTSDVDDDGVVDEKDLGRMLREVQKQQKEKRKVLKEFEESPY